MKFPNLMAAVLLHGALFDRCPGWWWLVPLAIGGGWHLVQLGRQAQARERTRQALADRIRAASSRKDPRADPAPTVQGAILAERREWRETLAACFAGGSLAGRQISDPVHLHGLRLDQAATGRTVEDASGAGPAFKPGPTFKVERPR